MHMRYVTVLLQQSLCECHKQLGGSCRNLGAGAAALLTDTDRLTTLIAGLSVLALGVYSAREGTRVAGRAFDRSAHIFMLPACPLHCDA